MERINVRIRGSRPLLMNSCQQMITAKENEETKKRGRADNIPAQVEAERCLYKAADGTVFIPAFCLLSSMRGAAVNRLVPGRGKKTYKGYIFSGVRITPDEMPVLTKNGWTPDLKPVVIGKARVIKARPRFDDWAIECEMLIVDPIISKADLKEILIEAGKYNGLCDFRPLYGLFDVVQFEEIKEAVN